MYTFIDPRGGYNFLLEHTTHRSIVHTHAQVQYMQKWRNVIVSGLQLLDMRPEQLGDLVPCSRAPWQCPEGKLAPLQLPVHAPYFGLYGLSYCHSQF